MIDDGRIAANEAFAFQTLYPRLHRCLGQAHAVGQFRHGKSAILRQCMKDVAVEAVQSIYIHRILRTSSWISLPHIAISVLVASKFSPMIICDHGIKNDVL